MIAGYLYFQIRSNCVFCSAQTCSQENIMVRAWHPQSQHSIQSAATYSKTNCKPSNMTVVPSFTSLHNPTAFSTRTCKNHHMRMTRKSSMYWHQPMPASQARCLLLLLSSCHFLPMHNAEELLLGQATAVTATGCQPSSGTVTGKLMMRGSCRQPQG